MITKPSFEDVRQAELEAIAGATINPKPEQDKATLERTLIGLALSGGGIRSASFNLGVLQALANIKFLPRVDYLSTVSGGGYIGGWLSAWLLRSGATSVFSDLRTGARESRSPSPLREAAPIQHLRRYSNFLTPQVGFLSADFWTAIATHLRNALLNLCILVPTLALIVVLAVLVIGIASYLQTAGAGLLWALGVALLGLGLYRIVDNLSREHDTWRDPAAAANLFKFVVIPSAIIAIALDKTPDDGPQRLFALLDHALPAAVAALNLTLPRWLGWMLSGALAVPLAAASAFGLARFTRPKGHELTSEMRRTDRAFVAWSVLSGALLGFLLWFALSILRSAGDPGPLPRTVGLGTVLVLAALGLTISFELGLMGKRLSEETREWWARAGAWCWILGGAWFAVFAFAFIAPPALHYAGGQIGAALGAGWMGTTLLGAALGKSTLTGTKDSNKKWEVIAQAAPYVFVLGLLSLAGAMNAVFLFGDIGECLWSSWLCGATTSIYVVKWTDALKFGVSSIPLLLLVYGGCAWFMSSRLDVNLFSFHAFYRNRLARCYLGASRDAASRTPDSLTGFDPHDDLALSALRTQRPFHLLNTALNLTQSSNLAWQERKAASFTLSPLFCGFDLSDQSGFHAYQPTMDFHQSAEAFQLSTAVTISGAAASPNAGYHSSPALAFLMTIFNVRLGYWIPNPKHANVWQSEGPRHAARYLLSELLGQANEQQAYVYLSDGGHFDNLGIYELIKRRCRYIIAIDAGCDPDFEFEDLGNAIRKCRIDLDVEIKLDVSSLRPDRATGLSKTHGTVGSIDYSRVDPSLPKGWLFYLKSSVTGDESEDIQQYRAKHVTFPHESTADQWFSESQIESYRQLGEQVVTKAFEAVDPTSTNDSLDKMFMDIRNFWLPESPVNKDNFSYHGDAIQKIMNELKEDPKLAFLDAQIVPEWPYLQAPHDPEEVPTSALWLPKDPASLRAGFYLCCQVIQVMENVYIDLRLEDYYDHPDNRGWMNQFRHWSWSGMFRATWAITISTYGARFQEFFRRHLDLHLGEILIEECARLQLHGISHTDQGAFEGRLLSIKTLNFLEKAFIAEECARLAGDGYLEATIYHLNVEIAVPKVVDAALKFPVGYLLACSTDGPRPLLMHLRIRDHLRQMGLARRTVQLIRKGNLFDPGTDAVRSLLRE